MSHSLYFYKTESLIKNGISKDRQRVKSNIESILLIICVLCKTKVTYNQKNKSLERNYHTYH